MDKKAIQDFVKSYNEATDASLKEKMVRSILNPTYIPFAEKIAMSQVMIDRAAVTYSGVKTLDENVLYFNYCMTVVRLYTVLEFTKDTKGLESYDALKSCGALDEIMCILNKEMQSEMVEFSSVYNNVANTFKEKELNIRFFIANLAEKISSKLNEGLLKLSGVVEKTDPETVKTSVETLKKEMSNLYKKAGK